MTLAEQLFKLATEITNIGIDPHQLPRAEHASGAAAFEALTGALLKIIRQLQCKIFPEYTSYLTQQGIFATTLSHQDVVKVMFWTLEDLLSYVPRVSPDAFENVAITEARPEELDRISFHRLRTVRIYAKLLKQLHSRWLNESHDQMRQTPGYIVALPAHLQPQGRALHAQLSHMERWGLELPKSTRTIQDRGFADYGALVAETRKLAQGKKARTAVRFEELPRDIKDRLKNQFSRGRFIRDGEDSESDGEEGPKRGRSHRRAGSGRRSARHKEEAAREENADRSSFKSRKEPQEDQQPSVSQKKRPSPVQSIHEEEPQEELKPAKEEPKRSLSASRLEAERLIAQYRQEIHATETSIMRDYGAIDRSPQVLSSGQRSSGRADQVDEILRRYGVECPACLDAPAVPRPQDSTFPQNYTTLASKSVTSFPAPQHVRLGSPVVPIAMSVIPEVPTRFPMPAATLENNFAGLPEMYPATAIPIPVSIEQIELKPNLDFPERKPDHTIEYQTAQGTALQQLIPPPPIQNVPEIPPPVPGRVYTQTDSAVPDAQLRATGSQPGASQSAQVTSEPTAQFIPKTESVQSAAGPLSHEDLATPVGQGAQAAQSVDDLEALGDSVLSSVSKALRQSAEIIDGVQSSRLSHAASQTAAQAQLDKTNMQNLVLQGQKLLEQINQVGELFSGTSQSTRSPRRQATGSSIESTGTQ